MRPHPKEVLDTSTGSTDFGMIWRVFWDLRWICLCDFSLIYSSGKLLRLPMFSVPMSVCGAVVIRPVGTDVFACLCGAHPDASTCSDPRVDGQSLFVYQGIHSPNV